MSKPPASKAGLAPLAQTAAPAVAHILRVLEGPQRGAVLPLLADRHYSVGSDWDADIVLRAAPGADEAAAARAEISLQANGLLVQVLRGQVLADGQPLAAGQSRCLPWDMPWQIGAARLAASREGQGPIATALPAAAPARSAARRAPNEPARGWGRRLATGGATVVVASLSMWALASAIAPSTPHPATLAQQAQASLHAAGMTAVTVTAPPGQGELLVEGYMDTRAQRTRAETLLAGSALRPRFAVWVNENLAQAVQDVYRVHGISADVQPLGPGRVRVGTALADPKALAAVEQTVRRDVQGLNQLEGQNTPPPGVPSVIPALDDPGKRVASLVAGATPYVVTQDGTRYFIGALLPTGHRILAIHDGRVELEREGHNSALVF